jgi:hypothetical protein
MVVNVFRFNASWPHQRLAWLRNVSAVDYSISLMDHGSFEFRLPVNDTRGVAAGDFIGIKSEKGMPDFAGFVDRIKPGRQYAEVSGREWSAILTERSIGQERTYASGASGLIALDLLLQANTRNRHDIQPVASKLSAPITSEFTARADSVLDALNALATVTGYEWQVRYDVGEAVSARLYWLKRIGVDRREKVWISGRSLSGYDYAIDTVSESAVVQAIGSSGDFGDRPSVVAVLDVPITRQDIAGVRLAVPTRAKQRRGIATRRETTIIDPRLTGIALQKRALEEIQSILAGRETLDVGVVGNWSRYRLGDTVTVRIPEVLFGSDLILPYRIYSLQPQHDNGTMFLLGKVVA